MTGVNAPKDDLCSLSASSKSPQVQEPVGHLDELCSADAVPAVYIRLLGGLHRVQVVGGLVQVSHITSVSLEHVDQHVPVAGNYQP